MSTRYRVRNEDEHFYSDTEKERAFGDTWRRKRIVPDRPDVGPRVRDYVLAPGKCRGAARHGRVMLKWQRVATGHIQRTCPKCHVEDARRSARRLQYKDTTLKRERRAKERLRGLSTREQVTQFILDGLGK